MKLFVLPFFALVFLPISYSRAERSDDALTYCISCFKCKLVFSAPDERNCNLRESV